MFYEVRTVLLIICFVKCQTVFFSVFRLTLDQFEADVSLVEAQLNKVTVPVSVC